MFISKTLHSGIITQELKQQQYPSSSESSSQQVLPQAFSDSLEDSCEDIEREFGDLTTDEQEEYKEFMAETYLESILNSRLEKTLFYIWDDTKQDTKTFIDSVFNALEKYKIY